MESIFVIPISAFIAVTAWLTTFAIKEYQVFKRLKIPSNILKYGSPSIFTLILWNIAANHIYSKMLLYVPPDKISEMNKSIVMMADKETIYFFIGAWLFIWFCCVCIDKLANSINKARNEVNNKTK